MKTIYKYPINIGDTFTVEMPEGAEVIHVAEQFDEPFMWAIVDNEKPLKHHHFYVFGTGHRMNDYCLRFVGTLLTAGGSYVWHIFHAGTSPLEIP